jgi:calcineurin-like phosphoesterase family protein
MAELSSDGVSSEMRAGDPGQNRLALAEAAAAAARAQPRSVPPERPKSLEPRELGFSPQPFVRWFHPFELARAGVRAVLADMFGAYTDRRELQAALYPRTAELAFDYAIAAEPGAPPPEELWLDFVADIGDGFDATYAVASLLAQPALLLGGPHGEHATRRGRILIMGGDEVYPAASSLEYKERTVGPYRAALPFIADEAAAPHLFAIPGNHDWYDGLSAFLRQFTQGRWIGAWKTRQRRSYFVLRLPHRIWVWGIDIQLHADIDGPQLAYFDAAAESLAPGDRVIICTAEPSWVQRAAGKRVGYDNLAFVESKALTRGARVVLVLTGDSHHYARYAEVALGRHYVTAGGGGAFLHGTHTLPLAIPLGPAAGSRGERCLERRATFPSPEESLALVPHLLSFSLENKAFALLWSAVWLLTAWCLCSASVPAGGALDAKQTFAGALAAIARSPGASALRQHTVLGCVVALALAVALLAASLHATRVALRKGAARLDPLRLSLDAGLWLTLTLAPALFVGLAPLGALLEALARSPMAICLLLAVLLGSMVFVSHERKRIRALVGLAHALVHVLLWLLIATGVAWLLVPRSATAWPQGWASAAELAIIAAWAGASALLAGVASATVFGIYLWYAGKYLPEQLNDAFSAIGIDAYKNFLRLHIAADGTLTVYPIGLRSIPKHWAVNPDTHESAPFLVPQGATLQPELIEPPIRIAPAAPEPAATV